jgi:predicted enzyme related to lactoylglutathione lyase
MNEIVDSVSARIEVADIKEALPLYRSLTGVDDAPVLEFPGLTIAVVGPFLLIQGAAEPLAEFRRDATLHVNDLTAAVEAFLAEGGTVVEPAVRAGGGTRAIVRDRDGNVFECFQRAAVG